MKTAILILLLIALSPVHAKKKHHESYYRDYQCNKLGGVTEYRPKADRYVRIDCELGNYSIEVDFAKKHFEAVGQALYYSALTGKKAGIWLIIEKPKQMKHAVRLARNIRRNKLPITVWLIRYRANAEPLFELYYKGG